MSGPTTHVIFDCCGTLVDVFSILDELSKQFAQEYNKDFNQGSFAELAEAENWHDGIKIFMDKLNVPHSKKDLDKIKNKYFEKLLKNKLNFVAGADKLVKHLHENNIPMAIATNLNENDFKAIIKTTVGFDDKYFSHMVCGANNPDVKNNKPASDIYLVCAERFSPSPKTLDHCVIFEDSVTGITGAIASGMKTVLLKNKFCGNSDLFNDKITLIIDSFDNFKPESVGLPPY